MNAYKGFMPHSVRQSETKDWLSFTLLQNGLFSDFAYRKLNSNLDKGFLECRRTEFNGKDKLSYKISGLTPISEIAGEITDVQFLNLMRSLFKAFAGIPEIGHLEKGSVLCSADLIFADENAGEAKLICFPINGSVQKGEAQLISELYSQLKLYKSAYKNLNTSNTESFFKALSKNKSPEEISALLEKKLTEIDIEVEQPKEPGETDTKKDPPKPFADKYVLAGLGKAKKLKFEFEEAGEYSIGRSKKKADYVIPDDFRPVSNLHCKITFDSEGWQLKDLNSTNGTRIGGAPVNAFSPVKLNDGDKILLAEAIEFIWKKA